MNKSAATLKNNAMLTTLGLKFILKKTKAIVKINDFIRGEYLVILN